MALLYCWSAAAGTGSGADWTNAKTTLTAAFTTEVAGDTIYVAHDHSESLGASTTYTSSGTPANPTKIICVNRAGSVPPVSADRRTTAQVATTGVNSMTLTGTAHYDGMIFSAGNGSTSTTTLTLLNANSNWLRFDNCSLRLGINLTGSQIQAGGTGSQGATYVELNNTTVSFAHAGHTLTMTSTFKWRNTPSALLGTTPNTLFSPRSLSGSLVECIGVDLSAAGSSTTLFTASGFTHGAVCRFIDCKLNASVVRTTTPVAPGTNEIDFIRSGSAGTNYTVASYRYAGTLIEEITIVRTGGATDGTTPISWKVVTTANSNYSQPFECPVIAVWNDTTGSARTATVECIWGGGAVPLDNEIWLDCEYLGDASSPQGSFINDGMPDLLTAAANQTSSSATWGGSTTKFKLNVTFTPQQKGWVYARVKCAKASSTFYIDPLVTLT